tara:strand:- start:13840 stop:14586 length:747 start_codon:yes stop_codon:yes gene_type:complete
MLDEFTSGYSWLNAPLNTCSGQDSMTAEIGKSDDGRRLKSELLNYKRHRILEQACHLFYELGYSRTTLEMVANALHVTKPFLYSYFKNKEAILAQICETGISESLEQLEYALALPGTHRDRFIELVRRVSYVVIQRQEHIVVYQREMKNLNRTDAQRILRERLDFDRQIAAHLRAGTESGEFDLAPDALTSVWIGGLISWIPVWYSEGGRLSKHDVVDQVVSSCLRMIGAEDLRPEERLTEEMMAEYE